MNDAKIEKNNWNLVSLQKLNNVILLLLSITCKEIIKTQYKLCFQKVSLNTLKLYQKRYLSN